MEFCLSGSLAQTARALWAQGKYIAAAHVWRRAMQALNNLMSGSVELPALPDGVIWPSPLAMSERLLEWQRRGAQFTATGYGTKIPTSKVIAWSDGKVRRVYCDIYSNSGSCYCMINGCKVSVDGFNLISEATK